MQVKPHKEKMPKLELKLKQYKIFSGFDENEIVCKMIDNGLNNSIISMLMTHWFWQNLNIFSTLFCQLNGFLTITLVIPFTSWRAFLLIEQLKIFVGKTQTLASMSFTSYEPQPCKIAWARALFHHTFCVCKTVIKTS